MAARHALLVAAFAAVVVRHRAPELALVHELLDSWRGIGLIVVGMERHGYRVALTKLAEGEWRAMFSSVGSAFLVDVADDILAIDCDSADRVEVVQEIATELQGHGYRPFGLLPVGPVTNICSSPSFVERQAGRPRTTERTSRSNPTRAKSRHVTEQDDLGSCHDESHGMSHRHHSDRAATRDDRNDGCGAPYPGAGSSRVATDEPTQRP